AERIRQARRGPGAPERTRRADPLAGVQGVGVDAPWLLGGVLGDAAPGDLVFGEFDPPPFCVCITAHQPCHALAACVRPLRGPPAPPWRSSLLQRGAR